MARKPGGAVDAGADRVGREAPHTANVHQVEKARSAPAPAGLTGGCQCGALRYRLDAAPGGANICHCRMCQKAGGAPFMAFAGVPNAAFVVTKGKLATFASSQIAERGFCAACGTPLTYRGIGADHVSVTIGSLDDPNAIAPTGQLGIESQVHWLPSALSTPAIRAEDWLAAKNIADVGNHQHPDQEN